MTELIRHFLQLWDHVLKTQTMGWGVGQSEGFMVDQVALGWLFSSTQVLQFSPIYIIPYLSCNHLPRVLHSISDRQNCKIKHFLLWLHWRWWQETHPKHCYQIASQHGIIYQMTNIQNTSTFSKWEWLRTKKWRNKRWNVYNFLLHSLLCCTKQHTYHLERTKKGVEDLAGQCINCCAGKMYNMLPWMSSWNTLLE